MADERTYSKRSLYGQIAHEIGLEIVTGVIPAGTALPKEEVACAKMRVSRTAYREALKVLSAKNLVYSRPKTGTVVKARASWNMLDPDILAWQFETGPSYQFARSLYELRIMVEPESAALAAERATEPQKLAIKNAFADMMRAAPGSAAHVAADVAFHQAILFASRNELLPTLGSLIETGLAKGFQLTNFDPEYKSIALGQHGNVAQAIAEGDATAARREMREIIVAAWEEMKHTIETSGDSEDANVKFDDKYLLAPKEEAHRSSEKPGGR